MNRTGNSILITGGGTEIGRGLAEAFYRDGNQVIIVLINNAGIMKSEDLKSGLEDLAIAEQTVAINLLGDLSGHRRSHAVAPLAAESSDRYLVLRPRVSTRLSQPLLLRHQGRHSFLDAVTSVSTARHRCGSAGDRSALCANGTCRAISG